MVWPGGTSGSARGVVGCKSCKETVKGWQDGLDRWGGGQKDAKITKAAYIGGSIATFFIPGGGTVKGGVKVVTHLDDAARGISRFFGGGAAKAAADAGTGAESALNGAQLNRHLTQLEKYGSAGSKELESGRIRYYGDITPAAKPGEMVGRRLVREWDPATDATRTWHETVDQSGNVRIVRPETGGPKVHYYFDEFGNYGGSW